MASKSRLARKTPRVIKSPKPAQFTPEDRAKLRAKVEKRATSGRDELTFRLGDVAAAFGFAMEPLDAEKWSPIYFARNALDDARRTLRLVEEALLEGVDARVLQDVVSNSAKRAEVADGVLARFTLPKAEVAS